MYIMSLGQSNGHLQEGYGQEGSTKSVIMIRT